MEVFDLIMIIERGSIQFVGERGHLNEQRLSLIFDLTVEPRLHYEIRQHNRQPIQIVALDFQPCIIFA